MKDDVLFLAFSALSRTLQLAFTRYAFDFDFALPDENVGNYGYEHHQTASDEMQCPNDKPDFQCN